MRRFAITLTSKGQVTLPAAYRRLIGVQAGDRLALDVGDDGSAVLTRPEDDLSVVQEIVRAAREAGAKRSRIRDPVGDHLLAEDERTKSRR